MNRSLNSPSTSVSNAEALPMLYLNWACDANEGKGLLGLATLEDRRLLNVTTALYVFVHAESRRVATRAKILLNGLVYGTRLPDGAGCAIFAQAMELMHRPGRQQDALELAKLVRHTREYCDLKVLAEAMETAE